MKLIINYDKGTRRYNHCLVLIARGRVTLNFSRQPKKESAQPLDEKIEFFF